jgi:hypothetical protein
MSVSVTVVAKKAVLPRVGEAAGEAKCFIDEHHSHRVSSLFPSPMECSCIPKPLRKRIDRFSALALIATETLVEYIPQETNPARIGVFLGNVYGGWSYGEPQLVNLVEGGPRAVHAFQATAWFPAAAQGEVSIYYGFTGPAKTVSGGCLAGVEALYLATCALAGGDVDWAIAGAAESIVSPFAIWGAAQGCPSPSVSFGEGAAFLLLTTNARGGMERLTVRPLGFRPYPGEWYDLEIDGKRWAVDSRPRIPGVSPLLEIIERIGSSKDGRGMRLELRAASGQGFSVSLNPP